mgnify:FL=1
MSPKSINKSLELLGEDYDERRKQWKHSSEEDLNRKLKVVPAPCDLVGQQEHDNTEMKSARPPSYNIVLDNLDIRVLAADMTSDNQNKDYHWCNHNAILDRVNPQHLADDSPISDLLEVPNSEFIPSITDHQSLLSDFVVLVGDRKSVV